MGKSDQRILVVEREILFGDGREEFQGFHPHSKTDFESTIVNNLKVMRRGSTQEPADHPEGNAERDYGHKQPIGYTALINQGDKSVFVYQRATKDEHYGEKRLQGKLSCGAGGHIEPFDTGKGNPIKESVNREVLNEELTIQGSYSEPQLIGYINDEKDDVGKVHFGLLYLVEVNGLVVPKDVEMKSASFIPIGELEEMCSSGDYDIEGWLHIALNPIKDYLVK